MDHTMGRLLHSRITLHVIYWTSVMLGFILVQPYLFEQVHWLLFTTKLVLKFGLIIGMCYINLLYVLPKVIRGKINWPKYLILILILNFATALLLLGVEQLYPIQRLTDTVLSNEGKYRGYFFGTQFISNFWFLGSTTALQFARRYYHNRNEAAKAEIESLQTELKYLIAQINPHFLFNAINSIYVQIDRSNEKARETVSTFSEFLRYQLYECSEEKVKLSNEINYIRNYVNLQKMRKSSRHRINFNYPEPADHIAIPPLLFIGLIENAFKFLSNDKDKENYIDIQITAGQNTITFMVENSFNVDKSFMGDPMSSGLGLKNIKRRLELQFPEKHQFSVSSSERVFKVLLKLELE